jgi:hypothetical protein
VSARAAGIAAGRCAGQLVEALGGQQLDQHGERRAAQRLVGCREQAQQLRHRRLAPQATGNGGRASRDPGVVVPEQRQQPRVGRP